MVAALYTYQTLPNLLADLPDIQPLGYDSVMAYGIFVNADIVTMLDGYKAYGLKGIVDVRDLCTHPVNTSALTTRVNLVKAHPALGGFYTFDEPTTSTPAGDVELAKSTISALSSAPVYLVYPGYGATFFPAGSGITAYPQTTACQDVFGVDNYPMQTGSGFNETTYRSELAGAYGAVAPGTNRLIMVLQGCGYPSPATVPTAAQLLRMCVISGEEGWNVSGIWHWIWDWGSTLSPLPGFTWLKAMVADGATYTAIQTMTAQYRAHYPPPEVLGGINQLAIGGLHV